MEGSECGTVGHPAVNRESSTTTTTTCFPSMVAKDRIDPSTSGRNFGRVCVSCHTSKTPLWRGGPKGPKSLCNACGIKYRKARRALAAAAAGTDSVGCSRQRNPPFHLLDDQQDLDTKPIKKQYYRDTAVKYAGRGRPKKLSRISIYSAQCADFIDARDHQNKMLSNSIGLSKSPRRSTPCSPRTKKKRPCCFWLSPVVWFISEMLCTDRSFTVA